MKASLPPNVTAYKRTPTFTQDSLPQGLKNNHNTKKGVWAVIHVLQGKLRYTIAELNHQQILTSEIKGIISPQQLHKVEAIDEVSFYVEFHR